MDSRSKAANASPVIAVVVHCQGKIGLFKRSRQVNHDGGLWHCITGRIDPGMSPREQALVEVAEESGLLDDEITLLQAGPLLTLADEHDQEWLVHTFRLDTERLALTLNWEHDSYQWAKPDEIVKVADQVWWLRQVLEAVSACGPEYS